MTLDICKKCNGNGWIPNPRVIIRDPNSPDHIKCPACKGEGVI